MLWQSTNEGRFSLGRKLVGAALLCLAAGAWADPIAPLVQAGFAQWDYVIPGKKQHTDVAAWYPTEAAERSLAQGPYTLRVAPNAAARPGRHPLVIVSHGTGGYQLNHHELAADLARAGFVVVALTHNGDNFADNSLLGTPAYLTERPQQVSQMLDALLADAVWAARIDAQRIAFFGHSAGGFVGLALGGALPSGDEIARHCATHYDADAWFCARGGSKADIAKRFDAIQAGARAQALPPLRDTRIKAIAVAAPVGAFFTADALKAISLPTLVIAPGQDTVLVPRFHSGHVLRHVAGAQAWAFDEAGHFMAMSKLKVPVMAHGEDVNADPRGTDRATAIAQMGRTLPNWFNRALAMSR